MDLEEREQPPAKFVEDIFPLESIDNFVIFLDLERNLQLFTVTSGLDKRDPDIPGLVFPLIFPSLSSEDVLNYHGDPRWSEAVEHFFKFLPAHYDIRISSKSPTFPKHPLSNDIRHSLCKGEQEVFSERTTLIQLVEKFGSEIFHLDLTLTFPERTHTQLTQHAVIRSCLRHMPNLKTASIFVRNNGKFMTEPGDANLGGLVRLSTNVDGILSHDGLVVNSCLKSTAG
ncbi:hypothetical protein Ocin01_15972 [Orchesella cincta]|uniref:Uncharacterized protein n=1 Tax=Orchesella cincta TaxID=48709 RepID=A0A1D2MCK5_ORCCI|nr:hypothetical protein Ocin01_15972 [Orchesella cincta]